MKEELVVQDSGDYLSACWSNGVHLGDFVMDVDGYYGWWPLRGKTGSWPSYALRMIADKLDELNAEWDNEVRSYFEKDK